MGSSRTSAGVSGTEMIAPAGNVATPLLRQLQLPQQRLVAGVGFEVLDARVRFYEGQPAIALAVRAVQSHP